MRTHITILAATGSALCAAAYASTELVPDLSKVDRFEAVKSAELKGDLARIHENYWVAVSYYQQALRGDPQNAELNNKLGIVELKLNNRVPARKQFLLAVKYDPRNVSALNNLGAVSYLDKKYKPAVRYLKKRWRLTKPALPRTSTWPSPGWRWARSITP